MKGNTAVCWSDGLVIEQLKYSCDSARASCFFPRPTRGAGPDVVAKQPEPIGQPSKSLSKGKEAGPLVCNNRLDIFNLRFKV